MIEEQTPGEGLDLEAIERMVDAAAPGPWVKMRHTERGTDWWTICRGVEIDGRLTALDGRQLFRVMRTGMSGASDAALVTHAREYITTLIAEIRRLRAAPTPEAQPPAARDPRVREELARHLFQSYGTIPMDSFWNGEADKVLSLVFADRTAAAPGEAPERPAHPGDHDFVPDADCASDCGTCGWEGPQ